MNVYDMLETLLIKATTDYFDKVVYAEGIEDREERLHAKSYAAGYAEGMREAAEVLRKAAPSIIAPLFGGDDGGGEVVRMETEQGRPVPGREG